MTDRNYSDQGRRAKKNQRDRYWSLMLVGDHGRVIPFKRFKGIAISFITILILTLIALTVLSFLFWRQSSRMAILNSQLIAVRKQADRLRDEKDVLLARLVIEDKMPEEEQPAEVPKDVDAATANNGKTSIDLPDPSGKMATKSGLEKEPEKKAADVKRDVDPKVKLGARIQEFNVTFDHSRSVLQARFRIYNQNQPKEPLSGRVVVVFKMVDDPPMKWISVPTVQILNGRPDGQRGQIFKIRNYRTMTLKAYGMKYPFSYDTAAVYVFSAAGDLILNQEHEFKIDPPPASKPKPARPAPEPQQKSTTDKKPLNEATESIEDQDSSENTSDEVPLRDPSSSTEITGTPYYPDPYSNAIEKKKIDSDPVDSDTEQESSPIPPGLDEREAPSAPLEPPVSDSPEEVTQPDQAPAMQPRGGP